MQTSAPTYTVLSGGIGGAKLVLGLHRVLEAGQLQVIANSGDDFEHLGLTICPDSDTLIYTLAGQVNPDTGWGLSNESWQFMASLEQLGGATWFRLGDRDLATHIRRRELLSSGLSLSEVTDQLRQAFAVTTPVWPMSDDPVRTVIETDSAVLGRLDFQDYFVRLQAKPVARAIHYTGSEQARAGTQALAALQSDSLAAVILTPSNPWLSIDPILSVGEINSTIASCAAPVVAVSPIVGGRAIKGPTAKLMQETGSEVSVLGIAAHYRGIVDGLVIDTLDAQHQGAIEAMGIKVTVTNTVMRSLQDKTELASHVLNFAAQIRPQINTA